MPTRLQRAESTISALSTCSTLTPAAYPRDEGGGGGGGPIWIDDQDDDHSFDEEFHGILAACSGGIVDGSQQALALMNNFCSAVPFTTWCTRSTEWLQMAVTTLPETAALRACIFVLRSRGAEWPNSMPVEERENWSRRVREYHQMRRTDRLSGGEEEQEEAQDPDDNNTCVAVGVPRRKRTRVVADAEFEF